MCHRCTHLLYAPHYTQLPRRSLHHNLKNIAAAMGPKSRLLIAEIIVPAQTDVGEDLEAYWMDMVMLAIGGKERSEKDFVALFDAWVGIG